MSEFYFTIPEENEAILQISVDNYVYNNPGQIYHQVLCNVVTKYY